MKKFEGLYNYIGTHGIHNAGVWAFSKDGNFSISSKGAENWRLAWTKNNNGFVKLKSNSVYGSCPTDKNITWKYCFRPDNTDIGCNLFDWVETKDIKFECKKDKKECKKAKKECKEDDKVCKKKERECEECKKDKKECDKDDEKCKKAEKECEEKCKRECEEDDEECKKKEKECEKCKKDKKECGNDDEECKKAKKECEEKCKEDKDECEIDEKENKKDEEKPAKPDQTNSSGDYDDYEVVIDTPKKEIPYVPVPCCDRFLGEPFTPGPGL